MSQNIEATEVEMLEVMVIETKNEVLKNKILERLFTRKALGGDHPTRNEQMATQYKAKYRELEDTVKHFEAFLEEAKKKEEEGRKRTDD